MKNSHKYDLLTIKNESSIQEIDRLKELVKNKENNLNEKCEELLEFTNDNVQLIVLNQELNISKTNFLNEIQILRIKNEQKEKQKSEFSSEIEKLKNEIEEIKSKFLIKKIIIKISMVSLRYVKMNLL